MSQPHDLLQNLADWRMAGPGGFRQLPGGVVESYGGSGLLWYRPRTYDDFVLRIEWRTQDIEDNSGVFLRSPPLEDDPRPAIDNGYEVQIDDRGVDPERGLLGSALHLTGAIYKQSPARCLASRPVGEWNIFEISAIGKSLTVLLNNVEVSTLHDARRSPRGHICLQNHHEGSAVQFRNLHVAPAASP